MCVCVCTAAYLGSLRQRTIKWVCVCVPPDKHVCVCHTEDPVTAATSAVSRDLSDVTIDDDRSQLDEFLSSSAQLAGK